MSGPIGTAAVRRRDCVTWAVASRPFKNEDQSGDRYVCQPSINGVLIAAIDGTGHGAEAATAAKIAVATLEVHSHESPIALLLRCHQELKGTRGAVITTAFIHLADETLTWVGVGNVEGMLFHGANPHLSKPNRLVMRNGVLGYRLPMVREEVLPLKPLDTLILVTDGIEPDFDERLCLDDDPKTIADKILANHYGGNDDALVLVVRYMGGECERSPS